MDEDQGYRWEGDYEKTWETLKDDDESGGIEFSVADYVHASKRKRMLERKRNVRLGIMRHVYIIVDLSSAMIEKDFPPTRQSCLLRLLNTFIEEFFDQNPISQLGIIVTKDKRAEKISDLSGNARTHKEALTGLTEFVCSGEPSLQNAFELALNTLKHLPSHTNREILVIAASLTTCDPSNIYSTMEVLKSHKVRCSIISLSAEVHVYKVVAKETGGFFNVALDQVHLKDLLSAQTIPPPVKNLDSKLIRMGFPEHRLNLTDEMSACACHAELTKAGYFCPQCKAKYCSLPVECKICGLTLALAPHLARSYHHLFPMKPFEEKICNDKSGRCYSCCKILEHKDTKHTFAKGLPPLIPGQWAWVPLVPGWCPSEAYSCERCHATFCVDCELFVHECLHLCPGCI